MKKSLFLVLVLVVALCFMGCAAREDKPTTAAMEMEEEEAVEIIITEAEITEAEEPAEEIAVVVEVEEPEEPAEEVEVEEVEVAPEEPETIEVAAVKMTAMSDIRIKVLNGNGKRGSAKAMRERLESFGYTIERIDNAPRSTFSRNVVFYAVGFDGEAAALTEILGGNAIAKPLTWYSIFDVIAVTGKRP